MKKPLIFSISLLLLAGCVNTKQENAPFIESTNNTENTVREKSTAVIDKELIKFFEWPFTFDDTILKLEIPITKECQLSYSKDNISFNYPCDWRISSNEKIKYPVQISYWDHTPPGNIISVNLPAESFAEFEDTNKDLIEGDLRGISVREKQLTINDSTYQIKEYGQHGGRTFIIEIDGNYIKFGSETLKHKDLVSLYIILSSIKF